MILSVDTEVNGLDLRCGCKPFLVTTCNEAGENRFWEWEVDPLNREPEVVYEDMIEIQDLIDEADLLIFQNAKFDICALQQIYLNRLKIDWDKVRDTLISGHLLASNHPHSLDAMALEYLNWNIQPYEKKLEDAVKKARRLVETEAFIEKHGEWLIAKKGMPGMPSLKEETWRADYWLPRAVAIAEKYLTGECKVVNLKREKYDVRIDRQSKWGNPFSHLDNTIARYKVPSRGEAIAKYREWLPKQKKLIDALPELDGKILGCHCEPLPCHGHILQEFLSKLKHPWFTVCSEYANPDSAATLPLWQRHEAMIKQRGLWEIYQERLKLLGVAYEMEERGMPLSRTRLESLTNTYQKDAEKSGNLCVNIASTYGYDLELPDGGRNKSLETFIFEVLKLPVVVTTKKGGASLNKAAMEQWQQTLPANSKGYLFLKQLLNKRSRDTACAYLEGYKDFWHQIINEWYQIHPNLNITGTDTLRWSSNNPNSQNVSKREDFNLRYVFGPLPGYVWWALDYENLELRIPAYESGEKVMIEIFEKPKEPPYFGSYHLLNASIVYPDLFWPIAEKEGEFKSRYKSTWYQWVKNFGFAFSYGCMEETGDRTAHKQGAYRLVKDRLQEHSRLNEHWIDFANQHGYVETLADKSISPHRGYPLLCTRSQWGRISPTVPLNFHVQGSAMWATARAMTRCQSYLRTLGNQYRMVAQVHDELLFEMPIGDNTKHVAELKRLMELSGDDFDMPLTVSASRHSSNWSEEDA